MANVRPSLAWAWLIGLTAPLAAGCGSIELPKAEARDKPSYLRSEAERRETARSPQPVSRVALLDFERGPLALERALAIAEAENPSLRALEREVDAARGRELQAGLFPNPTIEFNSVEGPLYRGFGDSINVATASYPFPVGGRIAAAEAAAAKAREAAEADLDVGRRTLRADVRAAFATGLAWQARRSLADELTEIARRSREIAEQRVRAGDAPLGEQIKAEVEMEQILLDRAIVDSELLGARRHLAALLGKPDAPIAALAGSLPTATADISLSDATQRVLRDYPRIHALTRAWEAARLDVVLAQRERIPDVTLSLGGGSSPEVRANNDAVLELGISVPVPFFNRNQGRIAEAEANVGRAARQAEAGVNALLLELQEDHRRFTIARERARRYQVEILPRATLSLEQARVGYQAGKLRFIDVLDAQRTLGDARALLLDALRDLAVARAELDKFIGE